MKQNRKTLIAVLVKNECANYHYTSGDSQKSDRKNQLKYKRLFARKYAKPEKGIVYRFMRQKSTSRILSLFFKKQAGSTIVKAFELADSGLT